MIINKLSSTYIRASLFLLLFTAFALSATPFATPKESGVSTRSANTPPLVPKLRWMEGLRFYLLGCDGMRYSSEELECWENPKTKRLLEAKLKSIAERLKALEAGLQKLGVPVPLQLPAGDFTV